MNPERQTLQLRYKEIINRGLARPLRKAGFTRIGRPFARWIGTDFCYVVRPYRGKITMPGKSSFTIDCGVFVAATWQIYPEQSGPQSRQLGQTITVRISQICGDPGDKWWDLSQDDAPARDDAIIADLSQRVNCCVLPWFAQFRSVRDIGDYLAAPERGPGRHRFGYRKIVQAAGDLRAACLAYVGAGEFGLARQMLDLAERTINIPVSAAMNADLRERLERLIAEKVSSEGGSKS